MALSQDPQKLACPVSVASIHRGLGGCEGLAPLASWVLPGQIELWLKLKFDPLSHLCG